MATSPDFLRLAANATRALADTALDSLPDAVVVIDARHKQWPIVLANAAARRCLRRESDTATLIETPLAKVLATAAIPQVERLISADRAPASEPIIWACVSGERCLPTDIRPLSAPGQRLVMLTFAAQQPAAPDLAALVDALPLDLMLLDAQLKVVFANQRAVRSAGAVPGGLLGCSALMLTPTLALSPEVFARALRGEPFHDDALAYDEPGRPTRRFELDIRELKQASGPSLLVLSAEVTERRIRNRARAASERRLLALTEHATDIIAIAGADGRLNYVSGGVQNALGYTSEERESALAFDNAHPDDRGGMRAQFQRLVAGEIEGFSREFRIRHKDGSYRWLESRCVSALNNPLIRGVVINSRDVTERKQAEFRLAQREEVFRLAADAVDGIIFEWDLLKGTVHRSRGVQEVLGIAPEDLEETTDAWLERIHPRDFVAAKKAIVMALLNGRGWTSTYRIRDAQGRYRSILDRAVVQRNAAGDPVRAIGCCVDISEIKRLTDILNETQRSAKIGGWELSYATGALIWTEEMFRIYGTNARDFSLSWESMVTRCVPQSETALRHAWAAAEAGSNQLDLELEINTLQGERIWVRMIGHLETLAGLPFRAFGSVQNIQAKKLAQIALDNDITERKRLEQEILEVSGRERQSIGRDLHDGLGQELTGVALMLRGLATRIQRTCPEAVENVNEIVGHVNQSIETARSLARGLLPVRTESGGLVSALQALAAKSRDLHGLAVNFHADAWPRFNLSETDASHLYRIAQEALTNAARHGHASLVEIVLSAGDASFSLSIADNGQGLGAAPTSPSGMGLKIMKYRADMIGARFEVTANSPHGVIIKVSGRAVPA